MENNARKAGFTVIELMMAMAFLTFILIFVVVATVQVLQAYNKGLTMKSVNQSSRSILDQLSRDISISSKPKLYRDGNEGRLCTETASYVWNTIYAPLPPNSSRNNYAGGNPAIYLVRSSDPSLCNAAKTNQPDIASSGSSELLSPLVGVNDLNLTQVAGTTKLYQLDLSLGTPDPSGYESAGVCFSDIVRGEFCASAKFSTVLYLPKGQ